MTILYTEHEAEWSTATSQEQSNNKRGVKKNCGWMSTALKGQEKVSVKGRNWRQQNKDKWQGKKRAEETHGWLSFQNSLILNPV